MIDEILGKNSKICCKTRIEPKTRIGPKTWIFPKSRIWPKTRIGPKTRIWSKTRIWLKLEIGQKRENIFFCDFFLIFKFAKFLFRKFLRNSQLFFSRSHFLVLTKVSTTTKTTPRKRVNKQHKNQTKNQVKTKQKFFSVDKTKSGLGDKLGVNYKTKRFRKKMLKFRPQNRQTFGILENFRSRRLSRRILRKNHKFSFLNKFRFLAKKNIDTL